MRFVNYKNKIKKNRKQPKHKKKKRGERIKKKKEIVGPMWPNNKSTY